MSKPRPIAWALAVQDSFVVKGRGRVHTGACVGLPQIGDAWAVGAGVSQLVRVVGVESFAIGGVPLAYGPSAGVIFKHGPELEVGTLVYGRVAEEGD